MIEIINDQYFHLRNDQVSYLFYVMKNQQLGHLYYGADLGKLTEADLAYVMERNNKSAGTVKFYQDDSFFTLSDRLQEYPVYGSTDFKEGAIEVFKGETPLYLDFHYQDYQVVKEKKRELAFPSSYAEQGEAETLTLRLLDANHQLELQLNYTIFKESSAIVRSQEIRNLGEESVTIQKMLSGVLEIPNANYDFLHLSGAWLKERHLNRQGITQGTVSVGSLKGASGHQHNPFIALQEKGGTLSTGQVYGVNLVYSGNFISQAELDEWDNLRVMSGIHSQHFSWDLKAQACFKTPEAVFVYSSQGLNGMAQSFSRFIEQHIIDRQWLTKPRPIVFNNWEATYFDFNHDSLIELATTGKELGMECFVLDDGWFGQRNTDRGSLGDWYDDRQKFPQGIGAFAQDIHNLGLELGIWFEPEMISPNSQLYQAHPDWVVRHPYERYSVGRGQYVLDFANPAVVEGIYQQMKSIILETKLSYIKWDMNRNITEAYSEYLNSQGISQTEFFHRYITGVYQLYHKILSDFPEVLIEGCAGGGGRYDLGILFYSPQIWPSDDSDAVERLSIQSGTLLAYPLSTFSNHVSASPNHQVQRVTSLEMRHDVALFGPTGYELDLHDLSESEKASIKTQISFYREHRQLLTHGTFCQLMEAGHNEVAWGVSDAQEQEAVIGFYRLLGKPNGAAVDYLPIPFVSEEKIYQINGQEKVSGRFLKHIGLKKPYQFNGANHDQAQLIGDFQSFIYHIVAVS